MMLLRRQRRQKWKLSGTKFPYLIAKSGGLEERTTNPARVDSSPDANTIPYTRKATPRGGFSLK
jgi:hypothetical protein